MASYSVIIRNATVFDGLGSAPQKTDIGIESDTITFVGDLSRETAPEDVDASNLYAAPGFIDITNHSDTHWTLFSSPTQESLLRQGITTILGGNGGSSLAPIISPLDIENLQKWTGPFEVNINWQNVKEFFDELKNHSFSLNFATLVGHGTLRRVAGLPVEKMIYLLNSALQEGVAGISTSLGRSYELDASDAELEKIFSEIKKNGRLATHHLASEGADAVSAVSRIVSLSRLTGIRSHISHFKILGRSSWPLQKTAFEIIERARNAGVELTLDFFPYTATGSNLYLLLPEWAIAGEKHEILRRLSENETKNQITRALKSLTLHYEKIIVSSTLNDVGVTGKSLKEIAENAGLTPEDAILRLLLTNELQISIFNEVISEENLLEVAQKEYAAVSSDGFGLDLKISKNNLPHPRSFGAFPRAFRLLVKEKSVLSWEEIIRKMTSLPANIIGIQKRGQIKKSFFADIVLFDPETISDDSTYKVPARFSRGIKWLFVNGKAVLSKENLTGQMPGRIFNKF